MGQFRPMPCDASRTLCFLAAWSSVVAGGYFLLVDYSSSPGPASTIAASWPEGMELPLDRTQPTLVIFAHPRCPCTRASLRELERVLARAPGAKAHVIFFTVPGGDGSWARTDLWDFAVSLPGTAVHVDQGGRMALAFGAATSGEVAVYSPAGALLFQGGLTPSRGHQGDSNGARAVLAALRGERALIGTSPVFGCLLSGPAEGREEGLFPR